jgi:hypothetical protein
MRPYRLLREIWLFSERSCAIYVIAEVTLMSLSRRLFLASIPPTALLMSRSTRAQGPASASMPPSSFPAQDAATVLEMVTVAHTNLSRVADLVANRPALANCGWDWGFGDWETPLGAASHMGNRDIANALLGAGARPSIFCAAALGQLDVVKAFVVATPGIQRIRGPHGIPLLVHARAGGASEVVKYLEELQGANVPYRNEPLDPAAREACVGEYFFGSDPGQRLSVSSTERGGLLIRRGSMADRNLFHLGEKVFHPAGADAVRIRFAAGTPVPSLTIEDGFVVVTARRT